MLFLFHLLSCTTFPMLSIAWPLSAPLLFLFIYKFPSVFPSLQFSSYFSSSFLHFECQPSSLCYFPYVVKTYSFNFEILTPRDWAVFNVDFLSLELFMLIIPGRLCACLHDSICASWGKNTFTVQKFQFLNSGDNGFHPGNGPILVYLHDFLLW